MITASTKLMYFLWCTILRVWLSIWTNLRSHSWYLFLSLPVSKPDISPNTWLVGIKRLTTHSYVSTICWRSIESCSLSRLKRVIGMKNTLFVLVADHTNLSDRLIWQCAGHCAIPIILFWSRKIEWGNYWPCRFSQAKVSRQPYFIYLAIRRPSSHMALTFSTKMLSMPYNFLSEHYHLFNKVPALMREY